MQDFAVLVNCLINDLSSGRIDPGTKKGLRDRNSPTYSLSQNGYGDSSIVALQHVPCHEQ